MNRTFENVSLSWRALRRSCRQLRQEFTRNKWNCRTISNNLRRPRDSTTCDMPPTFSSTGQACELGTNAGRA